MSETGRRPRQGLEGLPVNSDEVWMFDGARAGSRLSDVAALVFAWLAVVSLALVVVWGRSVILGLLAALVLAFVVYWTMAKWRDRVLALRLEQRAASEDAAGS